MTQRLARVDPGRTQECLERNKNTEGQGSVHRDVLQERGENWGVQRGWVMRTTRTMTTTTTTTMSRWCWRRKCYFFGTLSDRSKDIRRYSCQNVANEQWTIVQKFGRSFAKGSKTTMKLVAKNHDDRLDEWNFIEGTLVVSKNFFFFFRGIFRIEEGFETISKWRNIKSVERVLFVYCCDVVYDVKILCVICIYVWKWKNTIFRKIRVWWQAAIFMQIEIFMGTIKMMI